MLINVLNRLVSSKRPSLRLILVVPFVLQIFAAVGLTGYLSLRNGQQAVNDLATQLRLEIAARIYQHLKTYMATPHLINQINANAVRQGLLSLEDSKSLERYFWAQTQLFPEMATIAFANERGEFVGANGLEQYIVVANESTGGAMRRYAVDNRGDRTKLLFNRPNYDARVRSWYRSAVQLGSPSWDEVSVSFSDRRLDISATYPFYDKTGRFKGVLLGEQTLSQISNFLQSLKISRSGQTFIVERSGDLIGSSTTEQPFLIVEGKAKRLRATDSKEILIRSTAQYLVKEFGDFSQIRNSQQLNFVLEGQRQFVQVLPFQSGSSLDWLIVVVVPESDFMERINTNTRSTILLCLAALILAIILGILTARSITQPIWRLSNASWILAKQAATSDLARPELEQKVETNSVKELRVLAQAFNHMAQKLRESFTALEKANEVLEQRVLERTSELNEANQEITLLNQRLKTENLRMKAELEITRQLQQMILPKQEELQSIPELEITGFMEPAQEVGGDYYDVLTYNGLVKIGIGDVTGHGLESGVLMIMVQTAVRTLLANNETDPTKFLNVLNRVIYDNVQRMNSDKNLTLSLLDYHEGTLCLSGQHEEMIVVRSGGQIERFDTIDLGFPIGLEADISDFVANTQVQLNPKDVVVLYTDGITEAENQSGVRYGIERFCEVLGDNWHRSTEEIRQAVVEDVRQHIGEQKVYDDITLLILKQK
ncbi:MAG: SpoIIE family protein phosphatase [Symplocastrum torsivum CPER-KK1]|jgi:sigma-B regulation protein RsbU (phosphoserine phosphatase)|uniref:SpoIIE family protein phosphatase n=1 Tax=Symplocastrum torsivum CPER-KK1 TaxID=450513 RepID=A0A951PMQ2_9CYAN|nr:SpoIIE family protein phosphatase [Symplocastrum torsivum CPER-KK1]